MKTNWYYKRLLAMSPAEILYRLSLNTKKNVEKILTDYTRGNYSISQKIWNSFIDSDVILHLLDRDVNRNFYKRQFSNALASTLQIADQLCAHHISIFGQVFDLEKDIAWQRDPQTEQDWPAVFWGDIETRDGQTIGGVKWVWELNRHHHLVTLGKAYYLSGDERYAEEVCAQLLGWIAANPRHIGVNWTSSLELAIRLINWTWALTFIRHSPALTEDVFKRVMHSVVEQANYIFRHRSAYSSANNHLVGEAAGLAVVGLAFPDLPSAQKWRDVGIKTLNREIERQIAPDGVLREQAIHYLTFVLDFYLLIWQLLERSDEDIPAIWRERFEAACDFICALMDETGAIPHIGDSDDAWVVRLDERSNVNNYRSILASAAVILKNPKFKAIAWAWDEKSHWLWGEAGKAVYDALPDVEIEISSRMFRTGGYAVLRSPGRHLVFDCGPLGYLSIAAHGHADALSLWLSLEGQPVLIDSGTYAYQEAGKWRDYFRSTAAHNTLVVNGQNQSEIQGTFLWGRKAKTELLRWESNSQFDLVIAQHDGYMNQGVLHRRAVLFVKPDWCVIVDYVEGEGNGQIEQFWHFPLEARIEISEQQAQVTIEESQVWFVPLEMPYANPSVIYGAENPTQGWVSEHYGQLSPAPVLCYEAEVKLPVTWCMALCLSDLPDDWRAKKMQLWDLLRELEVV